MLGLLNTVLSRGGSLLTYVKDGLVMANRFLTPPKLTFPVDASAEFNGASDFITAPVLDEYNAITMGGWVYSNNAGLYQIPFGNFGETSTDGVGLVFKLRNNGQIWVVVGNTSSASNSNNSGIYGTYLSNKWTYLSATYDKTSCSFYQDGSLLGSFNYSQSTLKSETPFQIGVGYISLGTLAEYMYGNLANVAIWNRALSSDEINSVMWKTYEQVSTTEKSGLQAWYKLSADEVLSGDSTATLTAYANANALTFEAPACVQTALNGLPDITDARLYSANYDIRVSADGGTVESLSCVETELNAIL